MMKVKDRHLLKEVSHTSSAGGISKYELGGGRSFSGIM